MSDVVTFLQHQILRFSQLGPDQLSPNAAFADLPGWGSLPALQLLAAVEHHYPVTFEVREYLAIETIGDLAMEIKSRLPADDVGPVEVPSSLNVEA